MDDRWGAKMQVFRAATAALDMTRPHRATIAYNYLIEGLIDDST